jgi:hypothetical protein
MFHVESVQLVDGHLFLGNDTLPSSWTSPIGFRMVAEDYKIAQSALHCESCDPFRNIRALRAAFGKLQCPD